MRARQSGDLAIGFKLHGETPVLNPTNKGDKRKWSPRDLIVVLTTSGDC
jgi:hypothetical protein